MANQLIEIKRLEAGEITADVRGSYCDLLERSYYARTSGVNSRKAHNMAFSNFANGLDAMRRTAEDVRAPNFYAAHLPGGDRFVAVAKIGREKPGDRMDFNILQVSLARAGHMLGILDSPDIQLIDYGMLPAYYYHYDQGQELFRGIVNRAMKDYPEAEKMSAYIDIDDGYSEGLVRGLNSRKYKLGKKAVRLSSGGTLRTYKRGVVRLD